MPVGVELRTVSLKPRHALTADIRQDFTKGNKKSYPGVTRALLKAANV